MLKKPVEGLKENFDSHLPIISAMKATENMQEKQNLLDTTSAGSSHECD